MSYSAMVKCEKNGEGNLILISHGVKTKAVTPIISYVPTIIFNDSFSQSYQDEALVDFLSVTCRLLGKEMPMGCHVNKAKANLANLTALILLIPVTAITFILCFISKHFIRNK